MEYVALGSSGLQVPKLIFGCAGFGDITDRETARRLVDAAFDRGVNAFDTANAYNRGLSEEFLGQALRGRRDDAVVLTKVAHRTGADYEELAAVSRTGRLPAEMLAARRITPSDFGLSRRAVFNSVDASLRRLQTDRIDVLQLHHWDPTAPVEETLAALDDLVRLGKVHYVGCSSVSTKQLRALSPPRAAGAGMQSVQVNLSVLGGYRDEELPEAALAARVSVLAFGVLAAGLLGKRFARGAPPGPESRFGSRQGNADRFWNDATLNKVDRLETLARSWGRTIVDVAHGYVLAVPAVTAIIAGASSVNQLEERIEALDHPLEPEQLAVLARV